MHVRMGHVQRLWCFAAVGGALMVTGVVLALTTMPDWAGQLSAVGGSLVVWETAGLTLSRARAARSKKKAA